jgi:CheY-like chemotaxis protein
MITSSLIKNEDGIATLKFTVKDTGIGIPNNRLQAIFEPFVQASTDTTRKFGGTGLGLSICKNLVEMQGGEISAHSEQNVGTTFSFVIPYKISTRGLVSEEIKEEVNYKEIGKKKILVAEDVELNQFLAKHILESWGFTVDIANNGKEAVNSVIERNYDLILMDIQMPEMDGIEATQTIRKFEIKDKSNIPIIALTANALKGDGQRYLDAGMNDYITKPYTEERLYKVISKFLKPDKPADTNLKTDSEEKVSIKKLYNLSMINIIGKDSPVFAEKMVKLFINTIPTDLQTLEEATTNEDYQKVSFIAHKMKSTIDSMGINSISNTIRKLEMKDEKKVSKETILSWSNEVNTILKQVIIQMQTDFQDVI